MSPGYDTVRQPSEPQEIAPFSPVVVEFAAYWQKFFTTLERLMCGRLEGQGKHEELIRQDVGQATGFITDHVFLYFLQSRLQQYIVFYEEKRSAEVIWLTHEMSYVADRMDKISVGDLSETAFESDEFEDTLESAHEVKSSLEKFVKKIFGGIGHGVKLVIRKATFGKAFKEETESPETAQAAMSYLNEVIKIVARSG
ncbi:hypothetical protein [Emcibacter sp.]|uniref:hypothetical protein n=1 Tax=Emcibacter sp. TaxID=1979954 RepID=UPI003A928E49